MSKFYSARTATAVIVANMVGTGVFTSLGFQLVDIDTVFPILLLWTLGGIAALCGAASYAELGGALPRSGGEYNFLGRIYHPMAGFVSGWVSASIGFAAPIAAVAIAFASYSTAVIPGEFSPLSKKLIAVGLVLILSVIHSRNREGSARFQTGFTALKIILIIGFCLCAFLLARTPQPLTILPVTGDMQTLISGPFAVSLIYVTYAYTGWNAATYISGELENPQRDLPKILISGTGLVMGLYVLLNFVFLYTTPMADMVNQVEIGYIAAQNIFGETGARIAGGMLALLLISSVSAMTLAGPRALHAIGEDFKPLRLLGRVNKEGIPANAIFLQSSIAVIFILTSSFKTIIVFAGAMLAFNSFLAVLGVFVLRYREPDLPRPYRVWGYPFVPLIYLALTAFTLIYIVIEEPKQALFGLFIITVGAIFYLISAAFSAEPKGQ